MARTRVRSKARPARKAAGRTSQRKAPGKRKATAKRRPQASTAAAARRRAASAKPKAKAKAGGGRKASTPRAAARRQAPNPADIVRKVEQAWDSGRLDQLDQHFAPGFHSASAVPMLPPGLEGAKMAHQMSMQAFPDRTVRVVDMFGSGNKVCVRTRMTGTNRGGVPWFGAPANDARVDMETVSIYEVRNGKITRHWGVNDGVTLLMQLGVMRPPGT